jgi:hypothetical protein
MVTGVYTADDTPETLLITKAKVPWRLSQSGV